MTGKEQNTTHATLNLGLNPSPQWEAGYFLQEPADVFPTYVRTFSHRPLPAASRASSGAVQRWRSPPRCPSRRLRAALRGQSGPLSRHPPLLKITPCVEHEPSARQDPCWGCDFSRACLSGPACPGDGAAFLGGHWARSVLWKSSLRFQRPRAGSVAGSCSPARGCRAATDKHFDGFGASGVKGLVTATLGLLGRVTVSEPRCGHGCVPPRRGTDVSMLGNVPCGGGTHACLQCDRRGTVQWSPGCHRCEPGSVKY